MGELGSQERTGGYLKSDEPVAGTRVRCRDACGYGYEVEFASLRRFQDRERASIGIEADHEGRLPGSHTRPAPRRRDGPGA